MRDSLLQVAGELDPTPGGPDIDLSQGLTTRRRSLYFTHHGEARMPFLELFDAPDACDAYRRTTSVVPQQALALVNNELLLDLSRGLAARLWSETRRRATTIAATRPSSRAAFEQVLSRPPTPRERAAGRRVPARRQSRRLLDGVRAYRAEPAPTPRPGRAATWSTPCSATTISSRSIELS